VVPATSLRKGDVVRVEAGEMIPGDGEVIEGIAAVNEAAITGESAPVIRESGGDRSAVTGNTRLVSDWLLVKITANPGESTLDRMIALVEGAKRQKTPNEVALDILLIGLTLIFLLVVVTLQPFAHFANGSLPLVFLVALLVTLIPTTIGGLLSAIGIAGMDRLVRLNVIAKSGRAVEAAGDVHVLLLDKTGTITFGNRRCTAVYAARASARELAEGALFASLADDTAEGKSIVEYLRALHPQPEPRAELLTGVPFSAETRLSGVDYQGRVYRKGRWIRCWRSLVRNAPSWPRPCRGKSTRSPRAAARRCWSAPTANCSVRSTSRTWSSPASASVSPSCASWGFAR
jgi:K+-transporting ATPase ATPase B chain